MLLIVFSNWLHCHMFAVVFKHSRLWCVLPCHQFVHKCVASLDDFCYLLNLSFLHFLIEDLLIFRILSSLTWPFRSLSYVEFLIGGRLSQDALRFFGGWHDVDDFFNRLELDDFTGFFGLDFRVKGVELRMVKKRRIFGEKERKDIFEEFGILFEEDQ